MVHPRPIFALENNKCVTKTIRIMDGLFLLYIIAVVFGIMFSDCVKTQPDRTIRFTKDDVVMD